jgi:phosphotriesterase-related protein
VSATAIGVGGPVPAGELGTVDCHEHLAAPAWRRSEAQEPDLDLGDPARVAEDLRAFAAAGGSTVVEMTTVDYGRDLPALACLARATGVRILAATGFNKARFARALVAGRSPAALSDVQVREVVEGVDGVRCGLVKFGTSLDEIQPCEEAAGLAAARTHLETGVPISTHTEAGTMALAQLDLLERAGVAPSAVVVGHLDRNPDLALHREVARRGAFVAYDQLPKRKYASAGPAIANIVALARAGLHEHVLVGGDLSRRRYFRGWGGELLLDVVPGAFRRRLGAALADASLDADAVLADVYVNNPARAFALRPVG